jgi:hypothetical protein
VASVVDDLDAWVVRIHVPIAEVRLDLTRGLAPTPRNRMVVSLSCSRTVYRSWGNLRSTTDQQVNMVADCDASFVAV